MSSNEALTSHTAMNMALPSVFAGVHVNLLGVNAAAASR
jgi:hypothetical protein